MNNLEELIKLHEGFSKLPYQCSANKTTIGYGRNIQQNGITESEGLVLLRNDIASSIAELSRNFPHFKVMTTVRRSVLIDMCYNMGWPTLSTFKKMLAAVQSDDYGQAAVEMMDSKWFRQVGHRGERLVEMMLSDEWPHDLLSEGN